MFLKKACFSLFLLILPAGMWAGGILTASSAQAGPLRMMGFDAASTGTLNGQVSFGRGIGVLFSNPALLTDQDEGLTLGYTTYKEWLGTSLMAKPLNSDVPMSYYKADVTAFPGPDRPLPTLELPKARADTNPGTFANFIALGLIKDLDFGGAVQGLKLGLLLQVPTDGPLVASVSYADEREQYFSNSIHFARFGEWDRVISVLVGLGYTPKPWAPWISVGATAEVVLTTGLNLNLYTPDVMNQNYATTATSLDAGAQLRAIAGIRAKPLPWLSLGLVFRDRKFMDIDATASLKLWDDHYNDDNATKPRIVEQIHNLVVDYEPLEVAASAGVEFGKFKAQAVGSWVHWENYFDKHRQHPQDAAVFTRADKDKPKINGSDFRFDDTWSVNTSMGYEYLDNMEIVTAFTWAPSPVPPQTGRTNYVDNDVFGFSLGHRADLVLAGHSLAADVGFQLWYMPEITVHKDPSLIKDEFPDYAVTALTHEPMVEASGLQTNNPGFPGYKAGGFVFSAAATLTYRFK
ncbi:MAG: hypothetical protein GXP49_09780 [Deltaproteobacteria bacterium]|nr:hypothetical protein [Deltaproteobacteria bacterium]